MDPKNRFSIGASVGRDELGEVFRAEVDGMEPALALKSFEEWVVANHEGAQRYAEALERLASSGAGRTPPPVDWHFSGERGWMASGWVEAESLAIWLGEAGTLSPSDAIAIASGILDSLAELHAVQGAHGGLTPRKILLVNGRDAGNVVLTDPFQFELYAVADPIRTSRSEPDRYVGLPQYFSPEQAQGQRPDVRSDLYVVGLLVYEMITGKPPFQSNAVHTTLRRQIYEKPLPLRLAKPGLEADSRLEELLQTALAKDVGARFDSAEAMRSALTEIRKVDEAQERQATPLAGLAAGAAILRARLRDGVERVDSSPSDHSDSAEETRAGDSDVPTAAVSPDETNGHAISVSSGEGGEAPMKEAPSTDASADVEGEEAEADRKGGASVDAADESSHSPEVDKAPVDEPGGGGSRKKKRKGKRKGARGGQEQEPSRATSESASKGGSTVMISQDLQQDLAKTEPASRSGVSSGPSSESDGADSMTSGAWFAVGDDDARLREHHTQRIVLETPAIDTNRMNRRFIVAMTIAVIAVVGTILWLVNRPDPEEVEEPATAVVPSPEAPVTPEPVEEEEVPEPEVAVAAATDTIAEATRLAADSDGGPEALADSDASEEALVEPEGQVEAVEEAVPEVDIARELGLPEPALDGDGASERPAEQDERPRRERETRPAEEERPSEPAEQPARVVVAEATPESEPLAEEPSGRDEARQLVREGQSALSARDFGAARTAFERAIAADDSNAAAHAGLGDAYFEQRNYTEAARHHRRATRLAPRNAEYHRKLGMDFFRLNMFERALESFERAVELGDSSSQRFADIARDRVSNED